MVKQHEAEKVLSRITKAGFNQRAFVTACKLYDNSGHTSREAEDLVAMLHPSNWMTEEEVESPLQDAVLDLVFT